MLEKIDRAFRTSGHILSYLLIFKDESESCSVVSSSLVPHELSMEFSRPEHWSG